MYKSNCPNRLSMWLRCAYQVERRTRNVEAGSCLYRVEIYIVSQPRWQIWPRMFSLNESARGPCAFLRDLSKNLPSSYRVSWLSSYTDAS